MYIPIIFHTFAPKLKITTKNNTIMRKLTLEKLKAFNGKIFYTNVKGAVVACRFKRLVVYLTGTYRFNYKTKSYIFDTDRFSYTIECADGSNIFGLYSWLPEIYETIDDCVNRTDSLHHAVIDEREILEPIMSKLEEYVDNFGVKCVSAKGYRRNKASFAIEERGIPQCAFNVFTNEFDERMFKTREECAAKSPINVVTF